MLFCLDAPDTLLCRDDGLESITSLLPWLMPAAEGIASCVGGIGFWVMVGYVFWVWWVGANFSVVGVVSSLASTSRRRPGERIASPRVWCCVVVVEWNQLRRGVAPVSGCCGSLSCTLSLLLHLTIVKQV